MLLTTAVLAAPCHRQVVALVAGPTLLPGRQWAVLGKPCGSLAGSVATQVTALEQPVPVQRALGAATLRLAVNKRHQCAFAEAFDSACSATTAAH